MSNARTAGTRLPIKHADVVENGFRPCQVLPIGFFTLDQIVYWIGRLLGGAIAGLVYGYGLLKKE